MPVYLLNDPLWFPPVADARPDGLLAVGGDLSTERLLLAYKNGIFPWYNKDEIPMWWSPDPRFVLFPEDLKVSKSMRQVMNREVFDFRVDTAFEEVIYNCGNVERKGMDGTWISDDIMESYTVLHELGYAHSAEAWQDGLLVGGLYGVRLGNIFFGESMFSFVTNASKFAFIRLVELLRKEGIKLIDCQVHTPHLESLGARMIPRAQFIGMVQEHIG